MRLNKLCLFIILLYCLVFISQLVTFLFGGSILEWQLDKNILFFLQQPRGLLPKFTNTRTTQPTHKRTIHTLSSKTPTHLMISGGAFIWGWGAGEEKRLVGVA